MTMIPALPLIEPQTPAPPLKRERRETLPPAGSVFICLPLLAILLLIASIVMRYISIQRHNEAYFYRHKFYTPFEERQQENPELTREEWFREARENTRHITKIKARQMGQIHFGAILLIPLAILAAVIARRKRRPANRFLRSTFYIAFFTLLCIAVSGVVMVV